MLPRVHQVQTADNYTLLLKFSNNEQGEYNCSHLLEFGIFKELKNRHYFNKAVIENGTVSWPNNQDICPDTLYLDSKKINP